MWRFIGFGIIVLLVAVFGFSLIDIGGGDVSANAVLGDTTSDINAFQQAIDPWDWQFPQDHGPHEDFQTEWWYYTGNVSDETGRRFGYQFTVFRRAVAPQLASTDSEWRTGQIYMAHFTMSDIAGGQFFHDERYSRGGAGLAGATVDPVYRVWLEDWQVQALNQDATLLSMTASTDEFGIDLTLEQVKEPALQGQGGLSPKSGVEGNASYYYTLSRLVTDGTLTIGDETFTVTGNTWMDHEFSTSALGENAVGWDWFGLIFDDGRELMVGQIRQTDGGVEPAFGGLMIFEDGSTQYLDAADFTIEATDTWESPHTGAVYPSGWVITIIGESINQEEDFVITATPLMQDQELNSGDIVYWEGAVRIDGATTGYGYAELTGYIGSMTGRF